LTPRLSNTSHISEKCVHNCSLFLGFFVFRFPPTWRKISWSCSLYPGVGRRSSIVILEKSSNRLWTKFWTEEFQSLSWSQFFCDFWQKCPGTDIMIFKIFLPKKLAEKFWLKTKQNLQNFDHNIVFLEQRQFFGKNILEILISVPGHKKSIPSLTKTSLCHCIYSNWPPEKIFYQYETFQYTDSGLFKECLGPILRLLNLQLCMYNASTVVG
jgi:hypothetical protein